MCRAFPSSPAPPVTDDDPGNSTVAFRGEERSNATHRSTTDRDRPVSYSAVLWASFSATS